MGKEKIRTEIEFIPAKVKVIDYYRKSFQCLACHKEAHFSIEKPAMERDHPAKLQMNHPSSTAHAAELFDMRLNDDEKMSHQVSKPYPG